MIRSPRFPPDTLWFIFEEDFLLLKGNWPVPEGRLPAVSTAPVLPRKRKLLRDAGDVGAAAPTVENRGYAEDVVKIVTAAHRTGHGSFVWWGTSRGSRSGARTFISRM